MSGDGARLFASARRGEHRLGGIDTVVRTIGDGPLMLFVHGFPTHGFTWRDLLPDLVNRYTCILPDLPGLGESRWDGRADLSFTAQSQRLVALVELFDRDELTVVAHDTGATLARLLALACPERIKRLALLNTEIPGHRPPWIATYQRMSRLPGAVAVLQAALRHRAFVHSPMGLGAFYSDKALLDRPEVIDAYLRPLIQSKPAAAGALAYLRGIDWALVDGLARRHCAIEAAVLLLWGEDDPTFPIACGKAMAAQFRTPARFVRIPGTSLLPHEERPDVVAAELIAFASA